MSAHHPFEDPQPTAEAEWEAHWAPTVAGLPAREQENARYFFAMGALFVLTAYTSDPARMAELGDTTLNWGVEFVDS